MSAIHSPSSPPSPADGKGLWAAGKFFREGTEKVFVKGVSYGPFRPNTRGEPFPDDGVLQTDLEDVQKRGFNAVRLYELPTDLVITTATRLGLRLIVGIPWTEHVDFLSDASLCREIEHTIVSAVARLKHHPCIAAFLIGNEIEKTLVRWMGPPQVQHFLEKLISVGRQEAPGKLFSYATYPSTEYLIPRNADFVAVNVYLESKAAFAAYLQRLQNLAGNKPLVITEFGLDVAAHGVGAQVEAWQWFNACIQQAGIAGSVWFSYTDEWFRGGEEVTQWKFGLVDRQRVARWEAKEAEPQGRTWPKFSVIVCTYNGVATLAACLQSLIALSYADYEVLLIDDGSTKDIAGIAKLYPTVKYHRLEHGGLSVARNVGAERATGDLIAYTDDDCIADEDWLTYLAAAFDDPQCVAAGGPNIPPPPRNHTEATVAAAPGAPAHVLLNDADAEHLPGCNLAIRRDTLRAIGGFWPQYRVAGDDVDVCWRLREAGGHLRFVPAAMVWHHRRYQVRAYLRQQKGYGRAEALLMKDHPERFGPMGGARWSGSIYGDRQPTQDPEEGTIFHGAFGNGLFQGIYTQGRRCLLDWMSGVIWVVLVVILLAMGQPWLAGGVTALAGMMAWCRMRGLPLPPFPLGWRSRLLLLALCWVQPVLRESARLMGMLRLGARPSWQPRLREVLRPRLPRKWSWPVWQLGFWSDQGIGREEWLTAFREVLRERQTPFRTDDGWRWFDVEIHPEKFLSSGFSAVTEYHGNNRCLTKVRATMRPSKLLPLILGLIFALCSFLRESDLISQSQEWMLLFVAVLLMLFLLIIRLIATALLAGRDSVELAAARCGLKPVDFVSTQDRFFRRITRYPLPPP